MMYAKACRAQILSVFLLFIIFFPAFLGGCSGGHYSDFSLTYTLDQENGIQIPPGKSVSVKLTIGFIEGNPGDIHVTFSQPPTGVTITPNSLDLTQTGQQGSVLFTAAPGSPNTSSPVPMTITGVAGSATHTLTLYVTVAPVH